MKELAIFDRWAAAFALATGVPLLKVLDDGWQNYVFDDSDGQASRALGEWKDGQALVPARKLARAWRDLKQAR
jgi:hypothetical protein